LLVTTSRGGLEVLWRFFRSVMEARGWRAVVCQAMRLEGCRDGSSCKLEWTILWPCPLPWSVTEVAAPPDSIMHATSKLEALSNVSHRRSVFSHQQVVHPDGVKVTGDGGSIQVDRTTNLMAFLFFVLGSFVQLCTNFIFFWESSF
jgi:hypothetical protein